MISRKKIILKSEEIKQRSKMETKKAANDSNDNVINDGNGLMLGDEMFEDENAWRNLEQLLSDQISEILHKWNSIDDEIWAKVVCFERNRRIAKAYARSPVISVSGSDLAFDGSRIGLNAFPNCRRDSVTERLKRQIKSGFKLKIDQLGNIYIKRVGKCSVYLATANDIIRQCKSENENASTISSSSSPTRPASNVSNSPGKTNKKLFHSLELNKAQILFDMKRFIAALSTHTRPAQYPSASLLDRFQSYCIHLVQVVQCSDESCQTILRHPCWLVLANVVGLDLLWSRFGNPHLVMLNRNQLISVRSCFPNGSEDGRNGKQRFDPLFANNSRQQHPQINRLPTHHKSTDDLYYSGYMAKVSNNNNNTNNNSNNNQQQARHLKIIDHHGIVPLSFVSSTSALIAMKKLSHSNIELRSITNQDQNRQSANEEDQTVNNDEQLSEVSMNGSSSHSMTSLLQNKTQNISTTSKTKSND
ncbi:hypothetical protein RDWZM_002074 [Blomia tropicalis]|uniref:MH2 domain-containing protein n=1 Tax=Blomia tropicalis TaxID=40697 RepID=A0A9Q0MD57_BLOTA|nr:hypothetical protein RDWZM_002074 [Blomia tropicalis]